MRFLLPLGAMLLLLPSCRGRHADATPTGETVEVAFPVPESRDYRHDKDTAAVAPVDTVALTATTDTVK